MDRIVWQGRVLSDGRIASVDIILRELVEVRVGTVEHINATGGGPAVDSCELSVGGVVPHEQSVLLGLFPRRVKWTGFGGIERRKDTINIEIAIFGERGSWLSLAVFEMASAGVLLEIEFDLLACKLTLFGLDAGTLCV